MKQLINGGEAILRTLKANGINTVFGLLGGSMLELYDAIYQDDAVDYVGARDERAAAHMADAYARVSGQTGIVLGAQSGPGVANLTTGVVEAQLAYSPLVAIAGMTTREHQGRDTFQEFDQVSLFKPICKQSIVVPQVERLPEMLTDAIRLANSGRRGPVVLHVPRDLFAEAFEAAEIKPPSPVEGAAPARHQIRQILDLLAQSRAPVIFAGGGFKWAKGSAALQKLAEALQIPVVASTGHADVMPHDHALFAGQAGPRGNSVASGLTANADLILAIDNRLAFNSTFHSHDYVAASARIVQIDVEARAIGRYFPVELGIQADAKASAEAIVDAIDATGQSLGQNWHPWLEQFRLDKAELTEQRQQEARDESMPLLPKRVLGEIREAMPRDAIVTIDTGNACLQAADRLAHYQAPGLITPLDFGLVGFAYAAAIGARAATRNRPVIAVMGDGGFGFTMAEISTAVEYDLPVIAVVIDNAAWGAEKAYQKEFFAGRLLGAEISSPDYADVAELCGATGYKVTQAGETAAALTAALAAGKPAVIHVKVDTEALSALRKDLFKK
jgi:thiamine pyrophosphate-dependent acetolactate synthase large subunit-like protein